MLHRIVVVAISYQTYNKKIIKVFVQNKTKKNYPRYSRQSIVKEKYPSKAIGNNLRTFTKYIIMESKSRQQYNVKAVIEIYLCTRVPQFPRRRKINVLISACNSITTRCNR